MSLFGSLQIANNSLFAAQVGLQVTGNNIANANTPGYIRQRAVFQPATTQLIGGLPLGLGVRVEGIVQQADRFLSERLRGAISDLSGSEAQEETYLQLEALIGELSDTDLSTSLSNFFNSINDILNQPEDLSVRNLAILEGETLTADLRRLDSRTHELRSNLNEEIIGSADDINRILTQIAELNINIVRTEGVAGSKSEAVGLRDQREVALRELAEIVDIRVVEQPTGSVTVFAGGDFLVFEGEYRQVSVSVESDRGLAAGTIVLDATDSALPASGGRLAGLYTARDEILAGFLDGLDEFSRTLAFEFNKIHASGQGLTGHTNVLSERTVDETDVALDQAGLAYTPANGSFQIQVTNTRTGLTETQDVFVRLNGLEDDTTLAGLAAELNSVDGLVASVTPDRRLSIAVDSPVLEFGFAQDTSGLLAALGINTFFSGSGTRSLGVNTDLREDPSKFAASSGGIGADTENALALAAFGETPLEALNGDTLVHQYEDFVAEVTQASSVTKAVSEGFRVFQRTLEGQQLGLSGVSIDDEAVQMIAYQRAYQASARMIATLSELLSVLMTL